MIIKNFESLASNPQRKHALLIAEAGLSAINTTQVLSRQVSLSGDQRFLKISGNRFDLSKYKNILCVGFGKPAYEAVSFLKSLLQDKITQGFVISLTQGDIPGIKNTVGTHPLPSEQNIKATQEIISHLSFLNESDLVICVVGGGGSSLLCYPSELGCEMEVSILTQLTKKGADISEMNVVRKHISRVKGGHLAKICYPATVIGLIFSDVPTTDLSMVASGPTYLDSSTTEDASNILSKYDALTSCRLPYCRLEETPKDPKYFKNVHNILMVSSEISLKSMKLKAEDLGYKAKILPGYFTGKAKDIFPELLKRSDARTVILGSGETTVEVLGQGEGGRNQESVLAGLKYLKSGQVVLALASDGFDNTPSAGAIADTNSLVRAKQLGIDPEVYLSQNDSYSFFKEIGDWIDTGPTGSNISDLLIYINP